MRKHRFVFMNAAGAGGGGDPGGGSAAPAPAATDAPPAAGGATAAAPAAAGADTVLGSADAGAVVTPIDQLIPEKYRVVGQDGKLDLDASVRKVEEARSHLERRLGSGDAPPKEASEYKLAIPEAFKDKVDAEKLMQSEAFVGFRDRMHKAGLNQAQFEAATGEFFETTMQLAEEITAELRGPTKDQCIAKLRETWKTDAEMAAGIKDGMRALKGALGDEGAQRILAKVGNDPDFVMFAAAFGREMAEDKGAPAGAGLAAGESVESLMASEAYRNLKHPDNALVTRKVQDYFNKTYANA